MEKDQKDFNEYAAILKAEVDKLQNTEYHDWDSIVLHLAHGEKSVVKIKMMRQDMDAMSTLHGQSRSELIEMMVQTMEDEVKSAGE